MKNRFFSQAKFVVITPIFLVLMMHTLIGFSQTGGGYINYEERSLPSLDVTNNAMAVPVTPNWMDVKAVGMGKTQIANGRYCNAMLDNPALLSHTNYLYNFLGIQATFPTATFDATAYIKDNMQQFKSGDFLKLLADGFKGYYSSKTDEGRLAAIRKINQGLKFPNTLFDKIVVNADDPYVHGLNMIPSIQVQYGNWGFSLYGNANFGFMLFPGETLEKIFSLQIPENAEDLTVEMIKNLAEIAGTIFDENLNLSESALPQVFAMSNVDIIGAVGRSYQVYRDLYVGANLKFINRRFSTKLIKPDNLQDVLKEVRAEINHTGSGFTLDIGALYRYVRTGTRFGLVLQNVVPAAQVISSTTFKLVTPVNAYYVDDGHGNPAVGYVDFWGDFTPDPHGDTLLVIEKQKQRIKQPFKLQSPFLASVGVLHPMNLNWDLSFDWVDIFAQDDAYEQYIERFRLGTEYRIPKYKLALRGGIADKHITLGVGVRLPYVQLDTAYARDHFTNNSAYFIQLRFGY